MPHPLRYNPVAYFVMLGIHGRDLVSMEELHTIEAKKQQRAAYKSGRG